jgi:hypothetical protein
MNKKTVYQVGNNKKDIYSSVAQPPGHGPVSGRERVLLEVVILVF